jgi:hypothetical protein
MHLFLLHRWCAVCSSTGRACISSTNRCVCTSASYLQDSLALLRARACSSVRTQCSLRVPTLNPSFAPQGFSPLDVAERWRERPLDLAKSTSAMSAGTLGSRERAELVQVLGVFMCLGHSCACLLVTTQERKELAQGVVSFQEKQFARRVVVG